jgi:murein L,D-transpeptidase YcbB/YkuD
LIDRRNFLRAAAGFAAASAVGVPSASASSQIAGILRAELESGRPCASEAAALRGTLRRMEHMRPPGSGRTVVVDLPSQHLVAYEDRYPVLESRVVVGEPDWKTPDLDTTVAFVRFNPTWTVPESILRSRSWRTKLSQEPSYFDRLNFLVELDGRMVEPRQAHARASSVGRFVQQPGPGNALGKVKLGLNAGDAIYMHDTNDHTAFGADLRAMSHGCVRVEEAVTLASWVLGIGDADSRIESDDRTDYRSIPSPVRFVTTYFTAFPDASDKVVYYPDIYNRDGSGSRYCSETSRWDRDTVYGDEPPAEIVVQ